MAEELANVAKELVGQGVNIMADQTGALVADATQEVAKERAYTLGDQIANHTCDELNKRIPTMITAITDRIIMEMREKINSEEFTTDFINVLQTKLLRDETYSELFLTKFDRLFDTIISEAKNRYDNKKLEEETKDIPIVEAEAVPMIGKGYHKRSKTRRIKKKSRKPTKRVRFSMKK